jgi:hypothetical protein
MIEQPVSRFGSRVDGPVYRTRFHMAGAIGGAARKVAPISSASRTVKPGFLIRSFQAWIDFHALSSVPERR